MSSQTQSCQNTLSSSAASRGFHLDPLHCQIPFSYIKKIVQANYSTFLNVQQWQKNYKKAVSVSHHTSLSLFIIWKGRSRSDYEPSIPRFNILGSFFECSPSHLHSIFTSLKYASAHIYKSSNRSGHRISRLSCFVEWFSIVFIVNEFQDFCTSATVHIFTMGTLRFLLFHLPHCWSIFYTLGNKTK